MKSVLFSDGPGVLFLSLSDWNLDFHLIKTSAYSNFKSYDSTSILAKRGRLALEIQVPFPDRFSLFGASL